MTYVSKVINPVGPVGTDDKVCAATQQLPPPPTPAPAPAPAPASPRAKSDPLELPLGIGRSTMLTLQSRFLQKWELERLDGLCKQREELYNKPFNVEALKEVSMAAFKLCRECKLPRALRVALGRCLRRRWHGTPALREVMVHLLEAAAKGDNDLRAVVQRHGFDETGM